MDSPNKDSLTERILLHLYDCINYGFSYRAKKMFFIDDLFLSSNWKKFSKKQLEDGIRGLSKNKFIEKKKTRDGSVALTLTQKGILRTQSSSFKRLSHRKEKWDGKWRMVAFDIPEKFRKERDSLRYRFRLGEFYELRNSLFLYPYDCQKEVKAIVKLFKLEKYVTFAVLEFFDGQDKVKEFLGLQ